MLSNCSDSRYPQKGIVRGVYIAYSGLLATCLCLAFTGGARAQESPDASLQRLEQKFFQHSYAKDAESERIERIEKMVFGETRKGSDQQRLDSLVQAVPAETDGLPDQDGAAKSPQTAESPAKQPTTAPAAAPRRTATRPAAATPPPHATKPAAPPVEAAAPPPPDSSKYPAVTAIETRVLSKTYENEPVEERLNRLEAKVFGKPSRSDDLSERVDKLKQSTGIDVAARPPTGSDWTDDEDDIMPSGNGRSLAMPRSAPPTASADGEDGMSFSGRNLRQDFKNFGQTFGGMSTGGGSYGMGTGSTRSSATNGASGAYGFGDDGDLPPAAPQISRRYGAPNAVPANMGLTGQVTILENEVLGKTYAKDALPARVARLEAAIFPDDKNATSKPLPDRVGKLVATVGLNSAPPNSRRLAQRSHDPDFPDLDSDLPQVAPQRGGLGRIVNGLGNMMNGGFTGGYPMNGAMTTDPSTGLLFDPRTGNLIDPSTGMVIGRRVTNAYNNMPYGAPGYGMAPVGAYPYPSFGNGFSPMGSGMRFGTSMGGMGVGTGMGGMGVGRGFGMWP